MTILIMGKLDFILIFLDRKCGTGKHVINLDNIVMIWRLGSLFSSDNSLLLLLLLFLVQYCDNSPWNDLPCPSLPDLFQTCMSMPLWLANYWAWPHFIFLSFNNSCEFKCCLIPSLLVFWTVREIMVDLFNSTYSTLKWLL